MAKDDYIKTLEWLTPSQLREMVKLSDTDKLNLSQGIYKWADVPSVGVVLFVKLKGQFRPRFSDPGQKLAFAAWQGRVKESTEVVKEAVVRKKSDKFDSEYYRRAKAKQRLREFFRGIAPQLTKDRIDDCVSAYMAAEVVGMAHSKVLAARILLRIGHYTACPICERRPEPTDRLVVERRRGK